MTALSARIKRLEREQLTRWLNALNNTELLEVFSRVLAKRGITTDVTTQETALDPAARRRRIDELTQQRYGYLPAERHYLTDDEFSQIQSIQAAALARKRVGV